MRAKSNIALGNLPSFHRVLQHFHLLTAVAWSERLESLGLIRSDATRSTWRLVQLQRCVIEIIPWKVCSPRVEYSLRLPGKRFHPLHTWTRGLHACLASHFLLDHQPLLPVSEVLCQRGRSSLWKEVKSEWLDDWRMGPMIVVLKMRACRQQVQGRKLQGAEVVWLQVATLRSSVLRVGFRLGLESMFYNRVITYSIVDTCPIPKYQKIEFGSSLGVEYARWLLKTGFFENNPYVECHGPWLKTTTDRNLDLLRDCR